MRTRCGASTFNSICGFHHLSISLYYGDSSTASADWNLNVQHFFNNPGFNGGICRWNEQTCQGRPTVLCHIAGSTIPITSSKANTTVSKARVHLIIKHMNISIIRRRWKWLGIFAKVANGAAALTWIPKGQIKGNMEPNHKRRTKDCWVDVGHSTRGPICKELARCCTNPAWGHTED